MLENCLNGEVQKTVLRLASMPPKSPTVALLERGVNLSNIADTISAVGDVGTPLTINEIVDDAFRARNGKSTPFPVSRFSDGTIGVYYSAIEESTCKKELVFHLRTELAEMKSDTFPHPRYFSLINCQYSGYTADLRGKESINTELVSKSTQGYPFCQRLGLQANAQGVDGFLTASARNDGGTCVPVFARSALSRPRTKYTLELITTDAGIKFQRQ